MHRIILIALFAPACMFSKINQQNAAAKANYEKQQASLPHAMYVTAETAWLCPTEQAALATGNCDRGVEVRHNRGVQVKGPVPKDGIWRVWYLDDSGERELYVAATVLDELPDTQALASYAADVARRYPEAKRIPMRDINFTSLLEQPRAYRGYYLVLRQPSGEMTNQDVVNGTFRFTLPIPITTGSQWLALAQFELANHTFAGAFRKGDIGYECGSRFCDELVIVAELTGRTVDRVDELGTVRRLPVFAIRELGDRYGTYKPE